jgi:hypothetical protein
LERLVALGLVPHLVRRGLLLLRLLVLRRDLVLKVRLVLKLQRLVVGPRQFRALYLLGELNFYRQLAHKCLYLARWQVPLHWLRLVQRRLYRQRRLELLKVLWQTYLKWVRGFQMWFKEHPAREKHLCNR